MAYELVSFEGTSRYQYKNIMGLATLEPVSLDLYLQNDAPRSRIRPANKCGNSVTGK